MFQVRIAVQNISLLRSTDQELAFKVYKHSAPSELTPLVSDWPFLSLPAQRSRISIERAGPSTRALTSGPRQCGGQSVSFK
jgi:hypothetical protein